MNYKFDELTKQMAQSVTRRAALRKFGVGLAGMALACFGLVNNARAAKHCTTGADCKSGELCTSGICMTPCDNCVYNCVHGPIRGSRNWCTKSSLCASYCQ